jgi:hypothetical protein
MSAPSAIVRSCVRTILDHVFDIEHVSERVASIGSATDKPVTGGQRDTLEHMFEIDGHRGYIRIP